MKKILIVDDDTAVTNYLLVFLTQTERFDVTVVNDSREVMDLLRRDHFDAILLDMDMPQVSGMDILRLSRERGIQTPIVVLTGVGVVDLAVKAMKIGAFDYLTKPVDDETLLKVLLQAVERDALSRTLEGLAGELKREDLAHGAAFDEFITGDARMIRLLHEAEKMASGEMTIFIAGERGSGREKLARAIHEISPRKAKPFVALDADTVESAEELATMLFGRNRLHGEATQERVGLLEEMAGGTLFIDDIEHLSIPVQIRLKRVIQFKEFYRENSTKVLSADVRLILSSTKDLTLPEYKTSFSSDLLYHLMVNMLQVPPLRERSGDIPLIAEHVLRTEAARRGRPIRTIAPQALDVLRRYSFPRNDVELISILSGALVREESDRLTIESLPAHVRRQQPLSLDEVMKGFEPRTLHDVERDHVLRMIRYCGRDKKKAAAELGISVEQLEEFLDDRSLDSLP